MLRKPPQKKIYIYILLCFFDNVNAVEHDCEHGHRHDACSVLSVRQTFEISYIIQVENRIQFYKSF